MYDCRFLQDPKIMYVQKSMIVDTANQESLNCCFIQPDRLIYNKAMYGLE